MEKPAWHMWRPAACLRVAGSDALSFLQGQFTNDLRCIEEESSGAVYGLWLNQKGRVIADSFVLRTAKESYWVGSYFSKVDEIRGRLEAYIVADDVLVDDETDGWMGVTFFGSPEDHADMLGGLGMIKLGGRRGGVVGADWVCPAVGERAVRARLATWEELGAVEMERRRIVAGIPAIPRDIGPGDLPNEGGLEDAAISYTKGCYLGQEVMARLKSMGQVRRRLARVSGLGPAPAASEGLWQEGQKVGELRSVAVDGSGFIGLAMLSLLNFRAGAALQTSSGAELRWEAFV